MNSSCRLLLVEDNPDDVFLFLRAVNRDAERMEVTVAGDGEEAQQVLSQAISGPMAEYAPNLLVTDIKMPRWNGFELIRWAREQRSYLDLKIIALTSSQEPDDVARAYDSGADLFLTKPSSMIGYADLIHTIQRFCANPAAPVVSKLARHRNWPHAI